jgi:hypothetical protein
MVITESGRTKLDSSGRLPSPGGFSMTISVRASGDAADGVQELALDERPALDLQAQRHEKAGHDIEIGDRDADMVEAPYI